MPILLAAEITNAFLLHWTFNAYSAGIQELLRLHNFVPAMPAPQIPAPLPNLSHLLDPRSTPQAAQLHNPEQVPLILFVAASTCLSVYRLLKPVAHHIFALDVALWGIYVHFPFLQCAAALNCLMLPNLLQSECNQLIGIPKSTSTDGDGQSQEMNLA